MATTRDAFLRERGALLEGERRARTGGALTLDPLEQRLNATLMQWKRVEIERGYAPYGTFPPAEHFFRAKPLIDASPIFKLIQKMPKGGALHLHEATIADVTWLIETATYDKHCYVATDKLSGQILFHFFESVPSQPEIQWKSVVELRQNSADPAVFDKMLFSNLSLVVEDPEKAYAQNADIWIKFQSILNAVCSLVSYAPIFRAYVYRALQEFYDDGAQFIELREQLLPLYDLDGTEHDTEWTLKTYIDVSQQFVTDHPDFFGLRIIYTSSRSISDNAQIGAAIRDAIKYRRAYPDHFAGYDIAGDENKGPPTLTFLDELLYPAQQGIDLPYFFHAGETNWMDGIADRNLIDALLLNTSRVGHGFSLAKHPSLAKLFAERNIAVEICPISNQVLLLVKDLRNHPGAALLSTGQPVVISSDNLSLWGSTGLSHDLYEALMGLGGEWADLATLKQLTINSITYSSFSVEKKKEIYECWEAKWKEFVQQSLKSLEMETL